MPKLSKKGIDIPVSPIRKLVAFSEQAKARGVKVLHLNIGQPDIEAPRVAIDAVKNSNLKLLPYMYTPTYTIFDVVRMHFFKK